MKKHVSIALVSAATLLAQTQNSSATLLAGWDFTTLTNAANGTLAVIPSTVGTALIDVSTFGLGTPVGTDPERTSFGGTTLNAFPGGDATASQALVLANSSANGKSAIFSLNTTGYEDVVLTFATRGTSTGFATHDWSWSADGITYTPLISFAANKTATWSLETVDFSAISSIENVSAAYLQLTVSGATSAAGNNRLDNVQINATAVPEPTSLALIGGFCALALAAKRKK